MTQGTQRALWIAAGIVAMALSAATGVLYVKSRQIAQATAAVQGYRLVYVSMYEEQHARLQSYDLQGKDLKTLTNGEGLDAFPICEPFVVDAAREARIAFLRLAVDRASSPDAAAPGGVYVMDADGGQPKQINEAISRVVAMTPAWSPDARELAFAGAEDVNGDGSVTQDEIGVYVCHLPSQQTTRVVTGSVKGLRLSWSPVGLQGIVPIVRSGEPVACLLDAATGRLDPLLGGKISVACWSPDGAQIAGCSRQERMIHILPTGAGQAYSLEAPPGYVVDVMWTMAAPERSGSAEGRLRVPAATGPGYDAGRLYGRSASPVSTGRWEQLTDTEALMVYPSVSPDGRYVVYSVLTGGTTVGRSGVPAADLWLLELGQAEPRRLTSDPGFEGLATWVPSGS